MREVTEEAALTGVMMVLAGRGMLPADRATGRNRTLCRRGESIGLHGKAARRENLHQECQQKYWKGRFKTGAATFPPLLPSP